MNKNIEQIRAKNALEAALEIGDGKIGGEVVKKIPPMIRDNGILASAAFARDKREGYETVFHAIIKHLKFLDIMPKNQEKLIEWLIGVDSAKLRAVTEETMAYLNYLRRFVR